MAKTVLVLCLLDQWKDLREEVKDYELSYQGQKCYTTCAEYAIFLMVWFIGSLHVHKAGW